MAGTAIDARTVNRNYPKPFHTNGTKFDGPRLMALAEALDVDVATLFAALLNKANIASPVFSGSPAAPTPVSTDVSTRLATTAFVAAAIAAGGSGDFAPVNSPNFSGNPKAPTPAQGDSTTRIATTAFVATAIAALIGAAPGALNTLQELADALGDDPNFAATITAQLASKADASAVNPPSTVIAVAKTTAPAGYLKCNGAAISRTTYAALFAEIGTVFGAGDGSTTFNVPDFRGEFIRGLDDGRGVDIGRALGTSQASQNLAHGHPGSTADSGGSHSHGVSDPGHSHSYALKASGLSGSVSYNGANRTADVSHTTNPSTTGISIAAGGAHTHALTIASSGGTEARPRNQALLLVIKY